MTVWVVFRTEVVNASQMSANIEGVYDNEEKARKSSRLFTTQTPLDLRNKVSYFYEAREVE
jgi:hypothetical protein